MRTRKQWQVMTMSMDDLQRPMSTEQLDVIAECTALTKGLNRRAYELDKSFDVVVRALGWHYETGPWAQGNLTLELSDLSSSSAGLKVTRKGAYPKLSSTHESTSHPHVYFVGANAHGLDRARYQASGGFIHGFRFTTRTVFRSLLTRYEGDSERQGVTTFPWPPPAAPDAAPPTRFEQLLEEPLWKRLLERVLFSAASYEMIGGALVDGIVFHADDRTAQYIEEVPEDLLHGNFTSLPRLTFGYYGGGAADSRPLGGKLQDVVRFPEFAPVAHPFHPIGEYWPPGAWPRPDPDLWALSQQTKHHPSSLFTAERPSSRFHFKADRLTDFSHYAQVPLLDVFLRDVLAAVGGGGPQELSRPYHETHDFIVLG